MMYQQSATTDANGAFAFSALDPGRFTLMAQRDGFQPSGGSGGMATVTLAASEVKKDALLKIEPLGVVAGRIRDDDGEPLRRVQVALMAYRYTANGKQLTQPGSGSTDDRGEYRIFDVSPGKYYLRASPPGAMGVSPLDSDETMAPAFYPESSDTATAIQIEVRPGDEVRGIDLTLRRVRGATLSGRVARPPGLGQGSMSVTLTQLSIDGVATGGRGMATDQQGAFQIRGLAPGSYGITSQATVEGGRYSGRVLVQLGSADISGVEIRPMPPMDVNGSMRLEGSAVLRASQLRVMLQGQTPWIGSVSSAAAKDDGTFVLKNVEAGAYRVTVSPLIRRFGADCHALVRKVGEVREC